MANLASRANNYKTALHRADRIGFERGYNGTPMEPCPWSRSDFVMRYEQGWRRGVLAAQQARRSVKIVQPR